MRSGIIPLETCPSRRAIPCRIWSFWAKRPVRQNIGIVSNQAAFFNL